MEGNEEEKECDGAARGITLSSGLSMSDETHEVPPSGVPPTSSEEIINVPNEDQQQGPADALNPQETVSHEDDISSPNVESEQTTQSSDEEEDGQQGPAKRRPRRGFVNLNNPVFETNCKRRTNLAKKVGNSIITKARNLHIRTGADVYLKARYRGGRREPYIYSYGSDFSVDGEGEPASSTPVGAVDIAAVQQAIHASVKDAVSQIAEGNKKDITVPDSDESFNSPSLPSSSRMRKKSGSTKGCVVCGREDANVEFRLQVVAAEFFTCSRAGCQVRAHNDCLGFPNVNYTTIKELCKWFCPVHVGAGRLPVTVTRTLANEDSPVGASSIVPAALGSPTAEIGVSLDTTTPVTAQRPTRIRRKQSGNMETLLVTEETAPPEPKKRGRPKKNAATS